ncbi:Protein of unknown function [Gryllus bimaculatus]|nr:Protein of unknown function [Gryllus bimaculatus]
MTQNDIWVLAWLLAGLYQTVARTLVTRTETGQDKSELHMTVRRAHDPSKGAAGRRATFSDESWEATTPVHSAPDENRSQAFRSGMLLSDDAVPVTPRPRNRPRSRPRARPRPHTHAHSADGEREREREWELERERQEQLQRRRRRRERQRGHSRRHRLAKVGLRGPQRSKRANVTAAAAGAGGSKRLRDEFLSRVEAFRRDLFDQVMRMIRPASFPQARLLPASPLDLAARSAQTSTSTSTSSPLEAMEVRRMAEDSVTDLPLKAAPRALGLTHAQAPPRQNPPPTTPSAPKNIDDTAVGGRSGLTTTTAETVTMATARPRNVTVQFRSQDLHAADVKRNTTSSDPTKKEQNAPLQPANPDSSKSPIEVRSRVIGVEAANAFSPPTETPRASNNKMPELAARSQDHEAPDGDATIAPRAQNLQVPFHRGKLQNAALNFTVDTAPRQMMTPFNCQRKLA